MRVAIVIPTFNAGDLFDEVLRGCLAQEYEPGFEIIVIDSGSADCTLSVTRRHGVRFHQIPNSDFGHGRTRNLALTLTDADVIAYLTQDATPASTSWLAHLVAPLHLSPRIAAAYGRQQPRPGCRPTVKRDVVDTFRRLGPPDGLVLHGEQFDRASSFESRFFSNVNSAVRSDVLRNIPFRDVRYAEDQALAADLRDAGLHFAYAASAAVLHSHDLGIVEYFRRLVDEFSGLEATIGRAQRVTLARHLGAVASHSLLDVLRAVTDPDYEPRMRARYALSAPMYQIARRLAIIVGRSRWAPTEHPLLSHDTRRRHAAAAPVRHDVARDSGAPRSI